MAILIVVMMQPAQLRLVSLVTRNVQSSSCIRAGSLLGGFQANQDKPYVLLAIRTLDYSCKDQFGRPALQPSEAYQILPLSDIKSVHWSEHNCTTGGCVAALDVNTASTFIHGQAGSWHLARRLPHT
jgi:hypothetical protein